MYSSKIYTYRKQLCNCKERGHACRRYLVVYFLAGEVLFYHMQAPEHRQGKKHIGAWAGENTE